MNRSELELDILHKISQILGSSLELEDLFEQIMQIMANQLGIQQAAMVLHDESIERLRIKAAIGLTTEEKARGEYGVGEGVTGSVFATGQPRIIPDLAKEADFLNRTGGIDWNQESDPLSFICEPIKVEDRVMGAIYMVKPFVDAETLQVDARLLSIIAGNIALAIHINQLIKIEKDQWLEETQRLKENLRGKYKFDNIIGTSPGMLDVFSTIGQVATTRATCLILGETGTGKELIAKAIHFNSSRRDKPFIRVNCGSLSETLLESELFGHVKGSFTNAYKDKVGLFEAADEGTIFLDEIGTMDTTLQVKLLRVLQERELQRVGDHRTKKVDVRVITATNLDLQEEVRKGSFREDLYYRLNVVAIYLPPLRDRREDIPRLVDFFLTKYNVENGRNLNRISREMMNVLMRYPWPGNVRELENAIERAVVLCRGDEFGEDLLPIQIRMFAQQGRDKHRAETIEALARKLAEQAVAEYAMREGEIYELVVGEIERQLITQALERHGGTKTKAADFLGINRNTLNKKVKELNIPTAD